MQVIRDSKTVKAFIEDGTRVPEHRVYIVILLNDSLEGQVLIETDDERECNELFDRINSFFIRSKGEKL